METVKVLYLRESLLSSALIRAATWSSWSHAALILPNGVNLIDATYLHGGVKMRALQPVIASASKHEIREVACPNPQAAYSFALSQVGKPYDWSGVLGIAFHRDWRKDDAWFCSEFVEACLAAGGNQRFVNEAWRVTPQHSWMVA